MQEILFKYEVNPTTWAYLSALLVVGIYFKFRRFWSVRNLDLVGLIAFSPGLLAIYHGLVPKYVPWLVQSGYVWLMIVGAWFLVRLLIDPIVVRRPLLEPNLNASGLTFTGVAMLVFLIANVIIPTSAHRLEDALEAPPRQGPGYAFFYSFATVSDRAPTAEDDEQPEVLRLNRIRAATARTMAILGHLAVVVGLVLIGYRHFDNVHAGVAVASLYLLLPYTAQMTGRMDHVIPAALLVWAVEAYRRPVVAGILLGLAAAVIYYPLFILPLWCSFYWRRGLLRFSTGVISALLLMVFLLFLGSDTLEVFGGYLQQMFGAMNPLEAELGGFWNPEFHEPAFRIPVLAAFVALCGGLALWPAQKNLGTLLSCSAAVMLGTQFWQADQGGTYMAWYLPLLLLTIFRPNLEDRVALTALTEGWVPRWKKLKEKPTP
ncbi:MAG: hypothetical protein V3R99_04600 [Thermoguttaceae bacterium]